MTLKYFINTEQELRALSRHLLESGYAYKGDLYGKEVYDELNANVCFSIIIKPVDRSYSYHSLNHTYEDGGNYTLCYRMNEVVKRLQGTWYPEPEQTNTTMTYQEARALQEYLQSKGFRFRCDVASWRTDECRFIDIRLDNKTFTWQQAGRSLYPAYDSGTVSYNLKQVWDKLQ